MQKKDIVKASECRILYWSDFHWRGLEMRKLFYIVGKSCYSMGVIRFLAL